jgi:hypothetical protein
MSSPIDAAEFERKVRELANRDGVESLLSIPGVWELVSESLNNDAIRELESEADDEIQDEEEPDE